MKSETRKMFVEEMLVAMSRLNQGDNSLAMIVHDGGEEGATISLPDYKIELHHDMSWEIFKL